MALLAATDPVDAIVCAAPLLLALVLARTSQQDRQQYIARLLAAALMSPLLQLMFFSDRLSWPIVVVLAVAHFAAVVGAVFWLASATTRIAPPIGTPRTSPGQLLEQMQELPLPIRREGPSPTWIIDHGFETGEARSHRILLDVDPSRGTVFVREQVGASGARPRDADEASMRHVGDDIIDASRPDAQFVWTRCWQASIINLDQLGDPAPAKDPDSVVLQLCALVLRCGWIWQPVLIRPR
ncbi:hypothetical protein [Ideonella sp. YS5]|uniref:hypothetical protein n=1 Tax=Ideonella sp. YS5 TaxID=3453714 RepID=UPI003EE8B97F